MAQSKYQSFIVIILLFFCATLQALAKEKKSITPAQSGTKLLVSGKSLHLSCTKSVRDLNKNILECFGNVYIRRPSELLTSDYALLDLNTDRLHAEGNVVYFTPDTVVYGARMDFNFVTETGLIEEGRVEGDKYELVGEKIEKLSEGHFKAEDGEYTTCKDCPASWKIAGKSIDLMVDGYAFLSNVYIKVNDASSFYLPYVVFPVKTHRQTGFLPPRFGTSGALGFTFLQPFFWAISRSQDATLGVGFYSLRGIKGEAEYRYMLSGRSSGQLNAYYLKDRQFIRSPDYHRWALQYHHNWEFPFRFEQKFNYIDASDRDYPRKIGDIAGSGEPALVSEAGLAKSTHDIQFYSNVKRIRNLMTPRISEFDKNTVQLLPGVSLTSLNHSIVNSFPLHWGFNFKYARFWRPSGKSYDSYNVDDNDRSEPMYRGNETTPLRQANRFQLTPEIYYNAKIGDVLEVVPSVQYRTFYYLFDHDIAPSTKRAYLLAQTEVATTIEKVYGSRLKHKFRPSLTYSNIPLVQQDGFHPFIVQLKNAGNELDQFDIVPISSDNQLYFVPLGNSLSYRLGNKIILKSEDQPYTYRKVIDLAAGQSINFIEYRKLKNNSGLRPRPLSRFYSLLNIDTLRVGGNLEYFFYPYLNASTYSLSASYIFAKYVRRLLQFEQSLSLHYSYNQVTATTHQVGGAFNWSLNDYFSFNGGIDYLFPMTRDKVTSPGLVLSVLGGVTFQSPSQCFKINLNANWDRNNQKVAVNWSVPINLTGEGFSNLQDGSGLVQSSGQAR